MSGTQKPHRLFLWGQPIRRKLSERLDAKAAGFYTEICVDIKKKTARIYVLFSNYQFCVVTLNIFVSLGAFTLKTIRVLIWQQLLLPGVGEAEWQLRAGDLFLSSWRRNVKVSKRKSRRKNTKRKNEKGSASGRRFFCTSGQKKEEKWSVSWAAVPLVSLCLFFCCWSNLKHTNKLKQPFFNGLDIYANFNFILKEK